MRCILVPLLTLPLAAQTWDFRLEAPFPEGQSLPKTLLTGSGQLVSGDLDTGNGIILSVNRRLIRVGPVLRLEWGGEFGQWRTSGNIYFDNSNTLSSNLKQTGAGLGINAQLWIPFTGLCGEVGAIQRFQQYKFSSDGAKSDEAISRTWLRVGMRWRLPFIPVIHPYIAASYQQPINKEQPLEIGSAKDIAELFKVQGKGQEFQRLWTFGVGITL